MRKLGQEPSTPNRGLRVRDMTKETDSGLFDDSRRSFMKKGALTAGAVALGTAGAGTAAAQDGGDGEVIVHADDYFPGAGFTVAAALNNQTRDDLLEETGAADEFDSPDDWDAYIITYDFGGTSPSMGILMTEEADISQGDSETMGTDGQFRNTELAMVEATLGATGNSAEDGDGGDGDDGGDGGDTAGNGADNDSAGGDGGGGGGAGGN